MSFKLQRGTPEPNQLIILDFRFTFWRIIFTFMFFISAINHIVSIFTNAGVPEPRAEHVLFALVICPLMILRLYLNPIISLRNKMLNMFSLAQLIEHSIWIGVLGQSATLDQDIQNIVAITFVIVQYLFEFFGKLD